MLLEQSLAQVLLMVSALRILRFTKGRETTLKGGNRRAIVHQKVPRGGFNLAKGCEGGGRFLNGQARVRPPPQFLLLRSDKE